MHTLICVNAQEVAFIRTALLTRYGLLGPDPREAEEKKVIGRVKRWMAERTNEAYAVALRYPYRMAKG